MSKRNQTKNKKPLKGKTIKIERKKPLRVLDQKVNNYVDYTSLSLYEGIDSKINIYTYNLNTKQREGEYAEIKRVVLGAREKESRKQKVSYYGVLDPIDLTYAVKLIPQSEL
jgi:hypothetical protein